MSKPDKPSNRPQVILQNVKVDGFATGLHVKGDADIRAENFEASGAGKGTGILSEGKLSKACDEKWWRKPVGIVALAVIGGLILAVVVAVLKQEFPQWF